MVDVLPASQTTSMIPPETSAARLSPAGRCSCCCSVPCWGSWCAPWWELWFFRGDRRGTKGFTEEEEEEAAEEDETGVLTGEE